MNTNFILAYKERGLTRKRLAEKVGLTSAQIALIEAGYVPGPILRKRIAEALQMSETELWPSLVVGGEK